MARNNRVFYACQAVAITPLGVDPVTSSHIVRGAQSVGMNSTFTLDQAFELGQIEIYENIEEVADIEVTVEKVIDGRKLIYDLATDGSCKTDLVAASKKRCSVLVGVFDDGLSHATGVPRHVVCNSGMFVSSVNYSYTVDGSATETVGFAGNDRYWDGARAGGAVGTDVAGATVAATGIWTTSNPTSDLDGSDTALSGVVRRTDVDVVNSTIPNEVARQQVSEDAVGSSDGMRLSSITVSTDFGQENIQELGRFGPYTRFASFPIEVTCEFELVAGSGDLINVSGTHPNLQNRTIIIKDTAGTILNLGTANKLSSVAYAGGDTGGGNATCTYSYSNFNVLTVHGGAAGS